MIILYTCTALGFALNFHYCGNKVASVKIDAPAKTCGSESSKKMQKCCKDKKVDVKVKDVHQAEKSQSFLSKIFAFDLPALPFEDFFLSAQNALLDKLFDRGPPKNERDGGVSLFLKNCTFRL